MRHSESQTKIGAALVTALAELTNPPKTADNPFFKSKYAPLDATLDLARPILAAHGLAVLQSTESVDGAPAVVTRLVHASGEWIESAPLKMKPAKDDPQGYGGALTYARRYSLQAIRGITGETDDDGIAASKPHPQASTPRPQTQPQPQAAKPAAAKPAAKFPDGLVGRNCENCGQPLTVFTAKSSGVQWVKCPTALAELDHKGKPKPCYMRDAQSYYAAHPVTDAELDGAGTEELPDGDIPF